MVGVFGDEKCMGKTFQVDPLIRKLPKLLFHIQKIL